MEEFEAAKTPDFYIKEFDINEGNTKYKCQLQIINDFIQVTLYSMNVLKYKGNIHLSQIEYHLGIYNYTIDEIFDEINRLNKSNYKIIKAMNRFQLKIKFILFGKKKYIYIDLNNYNNNLKENDLINAITELKEKLKNKDDKIKFLEEELNKYKPVNQINISNKKKSYNQINEQPYNQIYEQQYENVYDNFDISFKEPLKTLNYHTNWVSDSTVLKDGRFVTCSFDGSIIIYNNRTFRPELIIKEHNDKVNNVIQLSSGILASCSFDKTIKLYEILKNDYRNIQTLKNHASEVYKIKELKNKKLVSGSADNTIIIYNKDFSNIYREEYSIPTNGKNCPLVQTKDNEICYYEYTDYTSAIKFFDLIKRSTIYKIDNMNVTYSLFDSMIMISNDLLLVTGSNKISIVNVNTYNVINTIDVPNSHWISCALLLNKNTLLTCDYSKRIIKWVIEGDNLKLISTKENAHSTVITTISKLGNGLILTGSQDNLVKIW